MYTERAESSVFPSPRFIPDPPRGERNVGKSARGIAFGSVKRNGSRLVDDLSSSLLFFFPFFLSFFFLLDSCSTPCHEDIDSSNVCSNNNVVVFSRAVNWLAGGKRSYRREKRRRTGGKGWLSTLNGPLRHTGNHAPLVNPLISQRTVARFDGSIDYRRRCFVTHRLRKEGKKCHGKIFPPPRAAILP